MTVVSVTVVGGELEQLLEAAGAAAEEADVVRHTTDTHTNGSHPVAKTVVGGGGGGVQAGQGG